MGRKYFRVIQTENTDEKITASEHQQKLNNYLEYDYPATNAELSKNGPKEKTTIKRDVHHAPVTSTLKNHFFILTSVLCCEDEEAEAGEKY